MAYASSLPCETPCRSRKRPQRPTMLLVVLFVALLAGGVWWTLGVSNISGEPRRVDVVFVLDVTGSMADEIDDVKTSMVAIGNRLANRKPQPDVRFGAVFYRDLQDMEITRVVPLSKDLAGVRQSIMDVQATGGGDWPEHVGIGLHKALDMDWSHSSAGGVRLIYLVGDAPPQTYDHGYDVETGVALARKMAVKINVVACSGLGKGWPEDAMRSIADGTGGTFTHHERQPHQHARGRVSTTGGFSESKMGDSPRPKGDRKMIGPVVGIDLGTSFSSVGVYKNGRVEVIPDAEGRRRTPSLVCVNSDGSTSVGHDILPGDSECQNSIFDVKGLMKQDFAFISSELEHLPYKVVEQREKSAIEIMMRNNGTGGDTYATLWTPEEISAVIFKHLKGMAENYLGTEVSHAVISVPAHFNDAQRQATLDSGKIAGLHVLRIISEPTAASIAYGLDKKSEQNILVCDLGGSTLDVSLLTIDSGVFEVVATRGDAHLGGKDFDLRMMKHFIQKFSKTHGKDIAKSKRPLHRLRLAVEKAKRVLSSTHQTRIEIPALYDGVDFLETLTRARFEESSKYLHLSTLRAVAQVLKDSGLEKSQIDEIVLVGGSIHMPKIQQLLKEFFDGKEPNRGINSDEAVVYGTAVQAGILGGEGGVGLLLLDVTPLTLSIETAGGFMTKLISRNTVIPTRKSQIFSTSHDKHNMISIQIYEGEFSTATENHKLGEFRIEGLPPAPARHPQVEVTFEIDSNGILNIGAEHKGTGKSEKVIISSDKNRLTEEQIERMMRDVETSASLNVWPTANFSNSSLPQLLAGRSCTDRLHASDDEAVKGDVAEEEAHADAVPDLGRLSHMMLKSIEEEL